MSGGGKADRKGRWRVLAIKAGLSLNGAFYPDRTLREAAPLFDGARVFVKSDAEHLKGGGKDVRNLIGRLTNSAFEAGTSADQGRIVADLELIDPAGEIGRKLSEAWDRGMSDLFGLSIDAVGRISPGRVGGKPVRLVEALQQIRSVDLIVEPGAGGRVIDLIEAAATNGNPTMDQQKIIDLITANRPELLAGKDPSSLGDGELTALLETALKPADCGDMKGKIADMVNRTKLPPASKQRVIAELGRVANLTEAVALDHIKNEIA